MKPKVIFPEVIYSAEINPQRLTLAALKSEAGYKIPLNLALKELRRRGDNDYPDMKDTKRLASEFSKNHGFHLGTCHTAFDYSCWSSGVTKEYLVLIYLLVRNPWIRVHQELSTDESWYSNPVFKNIALFVRSDENDALQIFNRVDSLTLEEGDRFLKNFDFYVSSLWKTIAPDIIGEKAYHDHKSYYSVITSGSWYRGVDLPTLKNIGKYSADLFDMSNPDMLTRRKLSLENGKLPDRYFIKVLKPTQALSQYSDEVNEYFQQNTVLLTMRTGRYDEKLTSVFIDFKSSTGSDSIGTNTNTAINDGTIEGVDKLDQEILIRAVKKGEKDLVKFYLKQENVDVNYATKEGKIALMFAAQGGDIEVLELLMNAKAKTNYADLKGDTALHYVTNYWINEKLTMAIRHLIKAGANINQSNEKGETAIYNLVRRGKTEAVESLIQEGADVDLVNHEGKGIMSIAVVEGEKRIVQLFLASGIDAYDNTRGVGMLPISIKIAKAEQRKIAGIKLTSEEERVDYFDNKGCNEGLASEYVKGWTGKVFWNQKIGKSLSSNEEQLSKTYKYKQFYEQYEKDFVSKIILSNKNIPIPLDAFYQVLTYLSRQEASKFLAALLDQPKSDSSGSLVARDAQKVIGSIGSEVPKSNFEDIDSTAGNVPKSDNIGFDCLRGTALTINGMSVSIDIGKALYVPTMDNILKSGFALGYTISALSGNFLDSMVFGGLGMVHSMSKGDYVLGTINFGLSLALPSLAKTLPTKDSNAPKIVSIGVAVLSGYALYIKSSNLYEDYLFGKLKVESDLAYNALHIKAEYAYLYGEKTWQVVSSKLESVYNNLSSYFNAADELHDISENRISSNTEFNTRNTQFLNIIKQKTTECAEITNSDMLDSYISMIDLMSIFNTEGEGPIGSLALVYFSDPSIFKADNACAELNTILVALAEFNTIFGAILAENESV